MQKTNESPATSADADADDASGFAAVSDAGSPSIPSVRLVVSAARVCPGDCVTVMADVENGTGTYAYTWSDLSWHGSGPHQLCLDTTTEIMVSARDAAAPSATQLPAAHTTIELSDAGCGLKASDLDATPIDAGLDAAEQDVDVCPARLDVMDGWIGSLDHTAARQRAVIDADGNLIVVASYVGSIHAGDTILASKVDNGVLVAKFSHGCKLLWLHGYSGPNATFDLSALVTDAIGNVVAVGSLQGELDLGLGPLRSDLGCALIARWDATGKLSWNRCIQGTYDASVAQDVLVDAANAIFVTGTASADADFGSGRLQGGATAQLSYLAKYSSQGKSMLAKSLGPACADSQLTYSPSSTILHKCGEPATPNAALPAHVVSEFDSQGRLLASARILPPFASVHPEFEIDAELNLVLLWPDDMHTGASMTLERVMAEGTSLWRQNTRATGGIWPVDMQIDAQNNSVSASLFSGKLDADGFSTMSRHPSGGDIYLEQRNRLGKLVRAEQLMTVGAAAPLAVAVDAQNVVFVVGVESHADQAHGPYELFVTKW